MLLLWDMERIGHIIRRFDNGPTGQIRPRSNLNKRQGSKQNQLEVPATKEDIQARRIYQAGRFLSLEAEGQLTREWRRYGENHKGFIERLRKAQNPQP